jgi:hypothetical protein
MTAEAPAPATTAEILRFEVTFGSLVRLTSGFAELCRIWACSFRGIAFLYA